MNDRQQRASNEAAALDRPQRLPRAGCRRFVPLATRWPDDDAYGDLDNIVYDALFDTVVNETEGRGHLVHVYVDRVTQRPVALADRLLQVVKELA